MILTTPTGAAVNMALVEAVFAEREPRAKTRPAFEEEKETWRVTVDFTGGGERAVAKELTESQAKFVLQDITRAWTAGYALFSVAVSLQQHAEGAYFTEEPA
jgi:hypothetical protein